jgi:NADPH:quinone reductase-like Zn-dependent oxidoreductase
MKANWIDNYGGADAMHFGEQPQPQPGPRDVLVRVAAASVNPIDWKMREGWLKSMLALRFPYVLGRDFSGVVIAVGAAAEGIALGDEVFGVVDGLRGGAHAEIVATDHDLVAKKPRTVSLTDAAALPLAGATALIALEDTAKLQSGERILIHGGAGGVGGLAVQIAKARGAWVAATCRRANLDAVRSLGADRVIDYAAEDFATVLSGLDVVYDTVGGEVHRRSQAVLKPGGRLVYIAAEPLPPGPPRADITLARADIRTRRSVLERIAALADGGKLKPEIAAALPLAEAAKAYEMCRAGNFRGKIVLTTAA